MRVWLVLSCTPPYSIHYGVYIRGGVNDSLVNKAKTEEVEGLVQGEEEEVDKVSSQPHVDEGGVVMTRLPSLVWWNKVNFPHRVMKITT